MLFEPEAVALVSGALIIVLVIIVSYITRRYVRLISVTAGLRELDEKLAHQAVLIEWLQEQSLSQSRRINELEKENALMRAEIEKLHEENDQLRAINEYLSRNFISPQSPINHATLREILTSRLNETDLRALAFDIGIAYDDVAGDNLPARIVEFISYCERHGMTDKMLMRLRAIRPDLAEAI